MVSRTMLFALAVIAATATAEDLSGLHDFDLRVGDWQVHHRLLKERLAGSHEWEEFDGTQTVWPLMDGFANADDNFFNKPSGAYRGVSLRAYDPQTGLWAIWWLDGRNPHHIDPPVIGGFEDGVGTFVGEDTFNGIPILVRFRWSDITPTTCRWEQAFSTDQGETWEVNWVMESTRIS